MRCEFKGDLAGVLFETFADYLSKERTPCQADLDCKFIWNRQVSHGGSTEDVNNNGPYVPTSKERRFSVLFIFISLAC